MSKALLYQNFEIQKNIEEKKMFHSDHNSKNETIEYFEIYINVYLA